VSSILLAEDETKEMVGNFLASSHIGERRCLSRTSIPVRNDSTGTSRSVRALPPSRSMTAVPRSSRVEPRIVSKSVSDSNVTLVFCGDTPKW